MTSMIDVVFLLIVFFTLVINFVEADQDERIKLPVSELAQPPEMPTTDPMTLHVLANGDVIYNGVIYSDMIDRGVIDRSVEQPHRNLRSALEHHTRFLNFMNIPLSDVTVIIRADAMCESGKILNLIELCQDLNLNRFVLRTRQSEE